MVSMEPKRNFNIGEKVLCFKGPLLYEATCLKAEIKNSLFFKKVQHYLVHYTGWNKGMDEWVPEIRILERNENGLSRQKQCLREFQQAEEKQRAGRRSTSKESKQKVQDSSVKKKTVDELLESVIVKHPEHTEHLIKQKFKQEDDCEILTTNLKASLICPVGKNRLIKPCRSKHCTHVQCIDARTVLSMNQNKPTWKCQICGKPAKLNDLYIDGLFLNILASVPWDVVEVEFQKDGSWTHKKSSSQKSVDTSMDKENTCITLDETIDKLDVTVIDLTETDEECSPAKRTPLKINSSVVHSRVLDGKKVHFEHVTSRTESSNYKDVNSHGCHRKKRHHNHHSKPYESSTRNNSESNGHRNNYSSGNYYHGNYCQTRTDKYCWGNVDTRWEELLELCKHWRQQY